MVWGLCREVGKKGVGGRLQTVRFPKEKKKKDEERCERHISPNLLVVIPRGREAIRHALAVQFQLLIEIQER